VLYKLLCALQTAVCFTNCCVLNKLLCASQTAVCFTNCCVLHKLLCALQTAVCFTNCCVLYKLYSSTKTITQLPAFYGLVGTKISSVVTPSALYEKLPLEIQRNKDIKGIMFLNHLNRKLATRRKTLVCTAFHPYKYIDRTQTILWQQRADYEHRIVVVYSLLGSSYWSQTTATVHNPMTMKSENLTSLIAKLAFGHDLELMKHTRRNIHIVHSQTNALFIKLGKV